MKDGGLASGTTLRWDRTTPPPDATKSGEAVALLAAPAPDQILEEPAPRPSPWRHFSSRSSVSIAGRT